MPVDMVLFNTKIYIHGNLVEAGIAIDDGKIVKIAKETNLPPASTKTNLKGLITLPGLIDPHVHLRDQQLAYKEDFVTGTSAAAAGGVTTVIDMPNNKPVTMNSLTLKQRMRLAEKKVLINVAFFSAFPKRLEEIAEVVKAGAVGFKVYLSNRIGGININDDELLLRAFRNVAETGVPVAVHAEDKKILEDRRREMEQSGLNNTKAYVKAHPPEAELKSIQRVIKLVIESGVHVHFCHVSSAIGLNEVIMAKNEGLPVTCEVSPHNLLLSSEHYTLSGTFALTDPPLRKQKDVSILWDCLKHGFINVIASDHAPHTLEEKKKASIWAVKPGIPGLDTTLSLLLTQVNKGNLSISELVRTTVEEPARIFKLSNRGFIEKGNWADLIVVDLKKEYTIDSSIFFSKAKYSPFDKMFVKGKPVKTFVNGKLVMAEGEIISKHPAGEIL